MPIIDEELLRYTLIGLEHEKESVEKLIAQLEGRRNQNIVPDQPAASKPSKTESSAKRSMSAEARRSQPHNAPVGLRRSNPQEKLKDNLLLPARTSWRRSEE